MKLDQGGTPPDWLAIPDPTAGFSAAKVDPAIAPRIGQLPASPTRAGLRRRRLLAFALAIAWCGLFIYGLGARPDLGVIAGFVIAQGLLCAGLVAVAIAAAWTAGRKGMGAASGPLSTAIVVVPGAFLMLSLLWTAPGEPSFSLGGADRLLPCMLIGCALALPALLVAGWASAHSFVSRAETRGAALGAGAGLLGALVLLVHCGNAHGGHVMLAHGLPMILTGLAGALLGRRYLRA